MTFVREALEAKNETPWEFKQELLDERAKREGDQQ
jgi:hypothetical protein